MKFSTILLSTIAALSTIVKSDDIDTTSYSSSVYDTLYEMTEFCEVAYCISEADRSAFEVGTLDCSFSFCEDNPQIEVLKIYVADAIESGTNYIAVDHSAKRILVVFRGSSTIFDWIVDFDFAYTPYTPLTTSAQLNYTCDDCYAHTGFYNTLKSFSDEVFPYVQELKEGNYSDYQIVTTGHSLGGALTNLAGIEFALMGYEPLVVGVAGPKVGNQAMADYMDEVFETDSLIDTILAGGELTSGFVRVVHQGDIVPLLPPTTFFSHGGAEFYIDKFLSPYPQSVTYFRGKYEYESITVSEVNAFIQDENLLFIYDHINYFVSMATCIVGNVFELFTGLTLPSS